MEDMVLNKNFWRGRSVFLTGHTGFKGSWLSLWLQRLGARVSGYALAPPQDPNLFTVARVADGMESTLGDVRDLASLQRAMAAARPDIAFHLAAQPLVRESYQDPSGTFDVNVMGTVNFLEAARRTPSLRAAVIITSDKCYENREWPWGYRETEPLGGYDPYSASKGCAELVTAAYRRSFFAAGPIAIASARAGNVIGGGDWAADRLLPDLVRAFGAGRELALRNPKAIRPWQHVLEPLRGYLMLAERLAESGQVHAEGWNFGPRDEDARPTLDLVRHAAELWGRGAAWAVVDAPQPHEACYLKLDCSKARALLGWRPAIGLETALEWTIAWYRAHLDGGDMHELSLRQIGAYEALAPT